MKLIQGTYGNRKSGKLYSYWAPDNARQGQKLNVPAYNIRAKRVVNTMLTVATARQAGGSYGMGEYDRLQGAGIDLKFANGTDTLSLPGGQKYQDIAQQKGLSETQAKSLWSLNSNIQNLQGRGMGDMAKGDVKARDIILGLNPKQDNTVAASRILGG